MTADKFNQPIKFQPLLLDKIWGGAKLYNLLNKGEATNSSIGESWEVSDNDTAQSLVEGGPFHGQSFRNLFQSNKEAILGRHVTVNFPRFPLLYKFIDATDDLSVQVHPGEGSPLGDSKTETWVVVDAEKDSKIIVGISSHKDSRDILEDLKTTRARSVLNQIPVKAGDVLFIPAGTVHAITKGLVIYEVQQNSDTTFRLYDWDRQDNNGNPRQLHINEAAQVIDYTVHDNHKIQPLTIHSDQCEISYLVACKHFLLQTYTCFEAPIMLPDRGSFTVLTCMNGNFSLRNKDSDVSVNHGESVLIPAVCQELCLEASSYDTSIIASFIPDINKDIIMPLKQAGYSGEDINKLGGRTGLYGHDNK
jgi:mannose-6-phosphate isomerase